MFIKESYKDKYLILLLIALYWVYLKPEAGGSQTYNYRDITRRLPTVTFIPIPALNG
jgi:hypothetical protein